MQIDEPVQPSELAKPLNLHFYKPSHPVWTMAFRPLYLLVASYGAISIILWGFGYQGTSVLSGFYWHAHEMIWGYAGAIVVAFLLTAVATWTSQPAIRGKWLMVLVGLWCIARVGAFIPMSGITASFGTAFFWLGAWLMGVSVVRANNQRNFIAVLALFVLGLTHASFHVVLYFNKMDSLHHGLLAGMMMVAGFIGLIGNRIISFFTARRLGTKQVVSKPIFVQLALWLPMVATLVFVANMNAKMGAIALLMASVLGVVQVGRWFEWGIVKEPLLWTLHLGYLLSSLGLGILGVSFFVPQAIELTSLGVHVLAVGGIGLLTVSMMVRTALGHTGRSLYPAPSLMPLAFWLMVGACVFRALAAVMIVHNLTAYQHSIRLSALLFAVSLLLYGYRYACFLLKPRIDGRAG